VLADLTAALITTAVVLTAAAGFVRGIRSREPRQQDEWAGPRNLECQEHPPGHPQCDVTRWRWPDA
jgi:hypothetical protein